MRFSKPLAMMFAVVSTLLHFTYSQNVHVSCEIVTSTHWHFNGDLQTCRMDDRTIISSASTECSEPRNISMEGLIFCQNENIKYLPVDIDMNFPKLIGYSAAACNIGSISKANFMGLVYLKDLMLLKNRIQEIWSDTFEDLQSLERLDLRQNRIKRLNAESFKHLKSLNKVWLLQNVCINKEFHGNFQFSTIAEEIGRSNCTFKDVKPKDFQDPFIKPCGLSNLMSTKVMDGIQTNRDEFPFLVALFEKKETESHFFCGATLITKQHVLTAAHCLQPKNNVMKLAKNLEVYIGSYNLMDALENSSEKRNVKKIILNPGWQSESDRYDADLAMIFLTRQVRLTISIQHICLPTAAEVFDSGTVVGWGETRYNVTNLEYPIKAYIKVIDTIDCFLSHPVFASIGFRRVICGAGEKAGPCRGDSGGGLYVSEHGQWTLAGVVSITLNSNENKCNTTIPAFYTRVFDYKPWIEAVVKAN